VGPYPYFKVEQPSFAQSRDFCNMDMEPCNVNCGRVPIIIWGLMNLLGDYVFLLVFAPRIDYVNNLMKTCNDVYVPEENTSSTYYYFVELC
jgi:hypothetical protein